MRLVFWLRASVLAGVVAMAASIPAWAGCVPYCNVGHEAPAPPTYTAAFSGEVIGYFYSYDAHNLNMIRFWDVTTDYKSPWVMGNLITPTDTKVEFGAVNQGDVLVFELWDSIQNNTQPGAGYIYYTGQNLNPDGRNHFYATQFMGGYVGGTAVPPGIFLGAEDLPNPYADWDYNDNEFVFRVSRDGSDNGIGVLVDGVSLDGDNVVTPEPASIQLAMLGILGIGTVVRRKFSL